MSKYIDVDALKADGWWLSRNYYDHYVAYTESKDLDDVPTVDAVKVVRCKECRHRPLMVDGDVKDPNYNESAWEEDYTCPYLCYEDDFYNCMPPDDGFCNYGERKDELDDLISELYDEDGYLKKMDEGDK